MSDDIRIDKRKHRNPSIRKPGEGKPPSPILPIPAVVQPDRQPDPDPPAARSDNRNPHIEESVFVMEVPGPDTEYPTYIEPTS